MILSKLDVPKMSRFFFSEASGCSFIRRKNPEDEDTFSLASVWGAKRGMGS